MLALPDLAHCFILVYCEVLSERQFFRYSFESVYLLDLAGLRNCRFCCARMQL